MPLFSICSLIVEADIRSRSFAPFMLQEKVHPKSVDLTIVHVSSPHSTRNLLKMADFSYITIWKYLSSPDNPRWVFEAKNGMCTISVDKDYTNAEYYYLPLLDGLSINSSGDFLDPYFQVLLECKLLQNGFSVLHSAAVKSGTVAYAFTGPSGIGKSSRAQKWVELFSAEWISGDRPAIDINTGLIYGVPWDGKEAIHRNINCPLSAIFKVKRSDTTKINKLTDQEKLQLLCEQTFFPLWDPALAAKALHSLKCLIQRVPVFELCSDITDSSIYTANELISEAINRKEE